MTESDPQWIRLDGSPGSANEWWLGRAPTPTSGVYGKKLWPNSTEMNVARTVVSTVSKSRSMQPLFEPSTDWQGTSALSNMRLASMKTIFSLSEIGKENQEGDQEFEMLMLDG